MSQTFIPIHRVRCGIRKFMVSHCCVLRIQHIIIVQFCEIRRCVKMIAEEKVDCSLSLTLTFALVHTMLYYFLLILHAMYASKYSSTKRARAQWMIAAVIMNVTSILVSTNNLCLKRTKEANKKTTTTTVYNDWMNVAILLCLCAFFFGFVVDCGNKFYLWKSVG